jgi:hypothetical protein
MSGRVNAMIGGAALALAVPGLALVFAAGDEPAGLAVAPFGWPRLVAVHLGATLPLSLWLGVRFSRPRIEVVAIVTGVLFAVATYALGPLVGPALDRGGADFANRLAVRVLWCLALQVPWCAAGAALAGPRPVQLSVLPLAVIAAVLPPLAFAHTRIPQWTNRAEELLGEMRLTRAWEVIAGLSDLGSTSPIGGRPPQQLAADVRRQVAALAKQLTRPLPPSAPPAARVEYARRMAMLDRLAEAEQLLAPLADQDVDAALLRATALQKLERWDDSDRDFRAVLDLSAVIADPDQVAAARVPAYKGLAFNARAAGRPADAEAAYREGLARVPSATSHFHFLLGRHYDQAGRPLLALEHLREAVRLDPGRYGDPARPLIEQLTRATPGCLLPRPAAPR